MKQLSSYVRAAGYLNKLFDLLNEEFFANSLTRPTITIQSTPKAYGHFTLNPETWKSITGDSYEINIGAGTLNRPIELTATTMYHEMCHLFAAANGIKDTSNGYVYHNSRFKEVAESHGGAVVDKDPSGRYGWTITNPSDRMLDFILKNELTDILIGRNEIPSFAYGGSGAHNGTGGTLLPPARKKSNSHKLVCPCCGSLSEPQKRACICYVSIARQIWNTELEERRNTHMKDILIFSFVAFIALYLFFALGGRLE